MILGENYFQTCNDKPTEKKIKLHHETEDLFSVPDKLVSPRNGKNDKDISEHNTLNNEKDNASTSSSSYDTQISENTFFKKSTFDKLAVKSIIGTIKVRDDAFLFSNDEDIATFNKKFQLKTFSSSIRARGSVDQIPATSIQNKNVAVEHNYYNRTASSRQVSNGHNR